MTEISAVPAYNPIQGTLSGARCCLSVISRLMTKCANSFDSYERYGNEYWLYISSTAPILTETPYKSQSAEIPMIVF